MNWTCWFRHSSDWTRVLVDGVWYRQCVDCQQPTTPILVNSEAQAITPANVPQIIQRHAQPVKAAKVPRMRKRKSAAVLYVQDRKRA